tara:strand:- start:470 stop:577 length:108 start_codon:yes stop_codon:yes gene_type:complete
MIALFGRMFVFLFVFGVGFGLQAKRDNGRQEHGGD